MSEQTTSVSRPSSGGVFTRKLGPLPAWAWMAIVLILVLVYSYYKKSKSASSTTGSNAQSASTVDQPGGVDASLVPQFINQTYENVSPPAAPNVTVNNTIPTPPTVVAPTVPKPPAQPKPPTTISGSPGSYTTGLAGGLNEWTSTGKYSLNTVAKSHGMTAQQLIAVSEKAENNPTLKAYVAKGNYNAMLPAGVEVFIPNANWIMKKLWLIYLR
jgi:hypothetical protein